MINMTSRSYHQKRLIPILLIRNNGLMKSRNFDDWTYVGDVINTCKIFNDKDVDEIVVLDTQASERGSGPNLNLAEQIAAECFLPISFGGGVKSEQDARALVERGVDKVVINSSFLTDPNLIKRISSEIGSSSTVVSIDVNWTESEPQVRNQCNEQPFSSSLERIIDEAEIQGAGEIVVQGVREDGSKNGPNLELAQKVLSMTDLPIVYAGGVSSLNQAAKLWQLGVDGVAAGSWFVFSGPLNAVLVTYPSRKRISQAVEQI